MSDESTGAVPFCFTHGTDWEQGCQGCEAAQPVSAMADEHRARYPRCRDWPLCDCSTPGSGWYSDDFRRSYEAQAASLTFRSSQDHGEFVVDLWTGRDDLVTVVSVRRGVTFVQVTDRLPEWQALAWETEPDPDPRARLMEALLQGHLRARERLTGEEGLAALPRYE